MEKIYDYDLLQEKLNTMIDHVPFKWQDFAESVIQWNYLAGNLSHNYGDEKYENQLRLIREEFKEALDEIESGNIEKLKSELIDLVVVSCYGMFLQGCETFTQNPFYSRSLSACAPLIMDFPHPREAFQWAVTTLEMLGDFEETACSVLQKNDSKIPLVSDFLEAAVGSNWALDEYDDNPQACPMEEAIRLQITKLENDSNGRYTGFHAKTIDFEGNQYIVFKDSNGKVMKNYCFYSF